MNKGIKYFCKITKKTYKVEKQNFIFFAKKIVLKVKIRPQKIIYSE